MEHREPTIAEAKENLRAAMTRPLLRQTIESHPVRSVAISACAGALLGSSGAACSRAAGVTASVARFVLSNILVRMSKKIIN
ncbi:hypothetical protein FACS1894167_11560 [Synergistales bacterium]|nr:hypothetical protein FACS1894167_11560 [Synergistales bacterium]